MADKYAPLRIAASRQPFVRVIAAPASVIRGSYPPRQSVSQPSALLSSGGVAVDRGDHRVHRGDCPSLTRPIVPCSLNCPGEGVTTNDTNDTNHGSLEFVSFE